MITNSLIALFKEDLGILKREIESYRVEKNLWKVSEGISNSAGNLCLHLIGNLNTYIGVVFGKTSYIRQRDLEFSLKNVPRVTLLQQLEEVSMVVERALNCLADSQFEVPYPLAEQEKPTNNGYMLIHLVSHLNYHLGQINYHRRVFDV
ncbi:MAG: uncharacterized protein JWP69_1750 [Flaviaesturariibacter sp.]|nr:uncharacterized protein [Flaviaesturariibacter sp.]